MLDQHWPDLAIKQFHIRWLGYDFRRFFRNSIDRERCQDEPESGKWNNGNPHRHYSLERMRRGE
jgi:hypothetical protein